MENLTMLEAYCRDSGIAFERGVPLAAHCTFHIGGAADLFIRPDSEQAAAGVCAFAGRLGEPLLVLGKGSNLLFPDGGLRGAVLHIGPAMGEMRAREDGVIDCGSGAALSRLCLFAWEQGLSGLEFAYGIPGSVGGAIYMNAGAYGGEMKDVLVCARHVGPDGATGRLEGEALALSYRRSAYTGGDKVILSGAFRLQRDDRAAIRARMEDYMERRRQKQPLDFPSVGSVFKRPEGAFASELIDRCGLKGHRVGGAQVSAKHAGFIINAGGATAEDVKALIALVQREVRERTGYELECEVRIV